MRRDDPQLTVGQLREFITVGTPTPDDHGLFVDLGDGQLRPVLRLRRARMFTTAEGVVLAIWPPGDPR